jgi:cyclase
MSISRRDFFATSALAAVAGTFGRPSLVSALQGQAQAPTPLFTPIRRNVGFFTMRGGTIGYLVNSNGVAVVDSQFPAEAKACLDGLKERSGGKPVDLLLNSHHHGDHSGGNISFRGSAKKVVAHAKANEHMRQPPGGQPPADQLFPDTTFTETWSADVGDEKIRAKHYGRAHTSGDAVITFERANVAHMGDLMFNQRHPVVDRSAGATIKGWMTVLERVPRDHSNDTIYIFGHAGNQQPAGSGPFPVTGPRAQVLHMRDYLTALLEFVQSEIKGGKGREAIVAITTPLKGFEDHGPLTAGILGNAYDDVTATS